MAATSIGICNLALGMLGIPGIMSFDELTTQARMCASLYPVLRDRLLREHTWSFALKSLSPAVLDEESPDPRYPLVCALPGDVIRIAEMRPECTMYRMIGKRILFRDVPEKVLYISRVEDPGQFDALFTEALQYLLASELAMLNTQNAQLMNFLIAEYEKRLRTARSIDSAENAEAYQRKRRRSGWIASRFM